MPMDLAGSTVPGAAEAAPRGALTRALGCGMDVHRMRPNCRGKRIETGSPTADRRLDEAGGGGGTGGGPSNDHCRHTLPDAMRHGPNLIHRLGWCKPYCAARVCVYGGGGGGVMY